MSITVSSDAICATSRRAESCFIGRTPVPRHEIAFACSSASGIGFEGVPSSCVAVASSVAPEALRTRTVAGTYLPSWVLSISIPTRAASAHTSGSVAAAGAMSSKKAISQHIGPQLVTHVLLGRHEGLEAAQPQPKEGPHAKTQRRKGLRCSVNSSHWLREISKNPREPRVNWTAVVRR